MRGTRKEKKKVDICATNIQQAQMSVESKIIKLETINYTVNQSSWFRVILNKLIVTQPSSQPSLTTRILGTSFPGTIVRSYPETI
jgi:hypothetical protein